MQLLKNKQLIDNTKFLEERLSLMMKEKEEQVILLKSQIIIYKQKAKSYKEQLLKDKAFFEEQTEKILNEKTELAKKEYLSQMKNLENENFKLKSELSTANDNIKSLKEQLDEAYKTLIETKQEMQETINDKNAKLQQIDQKNERKYNKIIQKKDETQKKLNVEEKERELYGLKLEQVLINNKKLMLQKKFLEKQLEKDMRELNLEMNKIQIEIQQDQLVGPSTALSRFKEIYQTVSDQMTYIHQIVGFMDFDQEGGLGMNQNQQAATDGQKQYTLEDVSREINEKIQNKNGGHDDIQAAQNIQTSNYVVNSSIQSLGFGNEINQIDIRGSLENRPSYILNEAQSNQIQQLNLRTNQMSSGSSQVNQNFQRNQVQRTVVQTGGGQVGNANQVLISEEECIGSYQRELLFVLLENITENFKEVKVPTNDHLFRLQNIIQSQGIDRNVVNEISDKFLLQNKIQFQQSIHKMNEKQKQLEIERKMLNLKIQRSKLDLKRQSTTQISQLRQITQDLQIQNEDAEQIPEDDFNQFSRSRGVSQDFGIFRKRLNEKNKSENEYDINMNDDGTEGSPQINSKYKDSSQKKQLYADGNMAIFDNQQSQVNFPAVPPSLDKQNNKELEQQIDFLKQHNLALKERSKEIRLNLQRKITELQDNLTISKQKYLTEISQLKVEYGVDLNRIQQESKDKEEQKEQEFDQIKLEEIQEIKQDFIKRENILNQKILLNEKKANDAIEQAKIKVQDAEKDLKKLKRESTGYFKGGWGTFIIAFEIDANLMQQEQKIAQTSRSSKNKVVNKNQQSEFTLDITPRGIVGKEKKSDHKSANQIILSSSIDASSLDESINLNFYHSIEKISHFVEVGFLIDCNNFRLLNNFEESTYDSQLKKFLFEFQDPISNFQMNQLEFKIKKQLTENVGLFNEINPFYVSLNMGRPSTPFFDDFISQENFKLIQREGLQLMGNRWMMINFLRCDFINEKQDQTESVLTAEQQHDKSQNFRYILRVVAFENSTSQQFSFDLNYNDLLTLMHGNSKLLEDENSHDLCQIILNNLSIIKRNIQDSSGSIKTQDVLIVEHRIFFNEEYRAVFDKKNKNIMAKYDKRRQGLLKDSRIQTEFQKSVIYEAYQSVYRDQIMIELKQSSSQKENLNIEILRGKMSGNIKLRVDFKNQENLIREMCLFAENQQKSHKICSEIIHVSQESKRDEEQNENEMPQFSTLAYVVSIEKVYGLDDTLIVRLVVLQKQENEVMVDYSWSPEDRPQQGSTLHSSQTLYLVKKSDQNYCRILEYEILNTEIRSQLFMHSYGYVQSNVDFGNIRRYLENGEHRRINYLSSQGYEYHLKEQMNINIQEPAKITKFTGTYNLIYRIFTKIRILSESVVNVKSSSNYNIDDNIFNIDQHSHQNRPGSIIDINEEKNRTRNESYSLCPTVKEQQIRKMEDEITYHDALVAIFFDSQNFDQEKLIIKIVNQQMGLDVTASVFILKEIITKEQFQLLKSFGEETVKICEKIIDHLIVLKQENIFTPQTGQDIEVYSEFNYDQKIKKIILKMEKDLPPISERIASAKQSEFEQMLRYLEGREDDHQIEQEIKDVQALKITLQSLADSPKVSQMSIINQKVYKVTAYFVQNVRGFEPKLPQRIYDWHFVFLEIAQRSVDQQIVIAITERDIVNIVQKLKQKMRVEGQDIKRQLLTKKSSKDDILNFILDCLVMDQKTQEVRLSMINLSQRFSDRCVLEEIFILTGGRYINVQGDKKDPELAHLKTSVPETELQVNLLETIQKDMSDKTYDVKIYEVLLKSIPGTKKFRFEIFWVEKPEIVFRCDIFSNENQDGCQMIIEKINIIEHLEWLNSQENTQESKNLNHKYDPQTFAKDGLVLSIFESNFPHQIVFMLLEPCSHIQWEYHFKDSKLNVIESREQRLNFVANLKDVLSNGILRGIYSQETALEIYPGDQKFNRDQLLKDTYYFVGDLESVLKSGTRNPMQLIYSQNLEITKGMFRKIQIFSDFEKNKLVVIMKNSELNENNQDMRSQKLSATRQAFQRAEQRQFEDIHILLNSQNEGSRILSGFIAIGPDQENTGSYLQNLIYTVEVSCSIKRTQKAIRFSLFNQATEKPILNVAFLERDIFDNSELELRDDQSFAIRSGFTDSLSIVRKMSILNYDYLKYEMREDLKLKLEESKAIDISKDFVDLLEQKSQKNQDQNQEGFFLEQNKALEEKDPFFVALSKLKQSMIDRSLRNRVLLYRKVMTFNKGKKIVMISVQREENPLFGKFDNIENAPISIYNKPIWEQQYLIKIILSENKRVKNIDSISQNHQNPVQSFGKSHMSHNSMSQSKITKIFQTNQGQPPESSQQVSQDHVFVYRYDEIFSFSQLSKFDFNNLKDLQKAITQVINKRLRIKEINKKLNSDVRNQSYQNNANQTTRYFAYFLDEEQLEIQKNQQSLSDKGDLLEGRTDFDMRQLHSYSLLNPNEKVLPNPDKKKQEAFMNKQIKIDDYIKDDLIFEVYEIVNNQELLLRFKVYNKETFKMLTSCDIGETELKEQLSTDKQSFLASFQQRDDLYKYIINNSYFDEEKSQLRFLISDLQEEFA